jgi:ferredoxin-NADP reductase
MNVTFHHRDILAGNIQTFWFTPERPVSYIAGQFTELYLPHTNADDRGERRWFTLSSSPTEPLLGVTTKFTSTESSSFKQVLGTLQPGAPLKLADPMGDFVLPKDASIPLIFVAAGLGITPVRSIVRQLHDTQEKRDIRLLYAAHDPSEVVYLDLFTAYGLSPTTFIKNPPAGYRGKTGSVTTGHVLQLLEDDDASLVYMSGPELLVETLVKGLKAAGIDERRLVGDYFPGYN